jgi:hypothetical protein
MALKIIQESYDREHARSTSVFSPEMIAMVKAARRYKIENKTRERQREIRGEVTKRSVMLLKKGPPAHVLDKMTAEQKRLDKVAREVSWGGYSGIIKRQLRMKMPRRIRVIKQKTAQRRRPETESSDAPYAPSASNAENGEEQK